MLLKVRGTFSYFFHILHIMDVDPIIIIKSGEGGFKRAGLGWPEYTRVDSMEYG